MQESRLNEGGLQKFNFSQYHLQVFFYIIIHASKLGSFFLYEPIDES